MKVSQYESTFFTFVQRPVPVVPMWRGSVELSGGGARAWPLDWGVRHGDHAVPYRHPGEWGHHRRPRGLEVPQLRGHHQGGGDYQQWSHAETQSGEHGKKNTLRLRWPWSCKILGFRLLDNYTFKGAVSRTSTYLHRHIFIGATLPRRAPSTQWTGTGIP